jgi:RNA polymerase-binding transcription factor DksA
MSPSSPLPTRGNPLSRRLPEYRAVLEEQWRQQLATIVELSYAALSAAPAEPDDDGARAQTFQLNTGLLATARQQLEETEAALARVDDGSYGLCGGCGGPIVPERLEVLPAARYCVACQARRARP